MSHGLLNLVGTGSATITITDPVTGLTTTVPVTVSSGGGGGTVTAMTLHYVGPQATQDVSTYNGLLLFTGNTYTLVAKDQSGNVLSSGVTWSSTDSTNAPINSTTGVVSPNTGVGGGTITCTHTASGVTKSVTFSVLKTPPAIYKQMGNPANTTALMAQISSNWTYLNDPNYNGGSPNPTGPAVGTALYNAQGSNHFAIASNYATEPGHYLMGKAGMVNTMTPTSTVNGQMSCYNGSFLRAWGLQVIRFDPGFSPNGQIGGSPAFKWGNWFGPGGSGRVGPEQTSGDIDNYCSSSPPNGGPGPDRVGFMSTEYTTGETWVSLNLYEVRGGNILSSRWAWFKIGDVPTTPFGKTLEGPMNGGASRTGAPPASPEYIPSTVNFNQFPPNQTQATTIFDWQLVDGDTYGDPYGILAATGIGTPTLTGISGGTVAHGTSSASIVLTGTNFNANCHPVFSNAKIYPQSITINSSTQMTVVVAVDATATTGAGTVAVNNQASQTTSGTQAVTVT